VYRVAVPSRGLPGRAPAAVAVTDHVNVDVVGEPPGPGPRSPFGGVDRVPLVS
jgi:hypothetical protein